MMVVRFEVEAYVQMVKDLLGVYPNVSVFVLAPLFRSQPVWYESVYGELSVLFCTSLSHVNPSRVKVVPPVDVSRQHLDPSGIHFNQDVQQLVVSPLLSSFLEGVFLNPTQYPIIDVIGSYLLCPSFLIIWSS
jgi:hypothetical protein